MGRVFKTLSGDAVETVSLTTIPRAVRLLEAMYSGIEVPIKDGRYLLASVDRGGHRPVLISEVTNGATGKSVETVFGVPMTLEEFTREAEAMPDADYHEVMRKLSVAKKESEIMGGKR